MVKILAAAVFLACLYVSASLFEKKWSGCWTEFVSPNTMCKNEFGAAWTNLEIKKSCGWFGAGRMVVCIHANPGCEASACYTDFRGADSACKHQFGNNYEYAREDYSGCFIGFSSYRCCPPIEFEPRPDPEREDE